MDIKVKLTLGDNSPEDVAEALRQDELYGHPFEWRQVEMYLDEYPVVEYTVHSMPAFANLLSGYVENEPDNDARDSLVDLIASAEVTP